MEKDILNLLMGKKIAGKTYANHPKRSSLPIEYDAAETDIIILEGVVALSSELLNSKAHLKIWMQVSDQLFTDRMIDYYGWREKSREETLELVEKRQHDEYQIIEKESKLADLFINSYGS
jgi:uridine kinase